MTKNKGLTFDEWFEKFSKMVLSTDARSALAWAWNAGLEQGVREVERHLRISANDGISNGVMASRDLKCLFEGDAGTLIHGGRRSDFVVTPAKQLVFDPSHDPPTILSALQMEKLVADAAQASEEIGEDELEAFAASEEGKSAVAKRIHSLTNAVDKGWKEMANAVLNNRWFASSAEETMLVGLCNWLNAGADEEDIGPVAKGMIDLRYREKQTMGES